MLKLINQPFRNKDSEQDHWSYNKKYCKYQRAHIWTKYKPPSKEECLQKVFKELLSVSLPSPKNHEYLNKNCC